MGRRVWVGRRRMLEDDGSGKRRECGNKVWVGMCQNSKLYVCGYKVQFR